MYVSHELCIWVTFYFCEIWLKRTRLSHISGVTMFAAETRTRIGVTNYVCESRTMYMSPFQLLWDMTHKNTALSYLRSHYVCCWDTNSYESRTMYVSHELCIWVTFSFREIWLIKSRPSHISGGTMFAAETRTRVSHELCMWVTNYVYVTFNFREYSRESSSKLDSTQLAMLFFDFFDMRWCVGCEKVCMLSGARILVRRVWESWCVWRETFTV